MPNREMLINYVPGEECRIAIIEDGRLEELYQERASSEMHVGNIYKARVINVEPSIQAAFVDFGLERNGFLHISDLHPKYFPGEDREETEQVGLKTPRRDRPPIQKCLRRGQEVLVQVLKEGIGTKGPTLTSYLSIPGRFLVMMPDMERMGVSRKVDDDDARRNMRAILDNLHPPKGFGFIIRTAGIGRTKHDLQRDLAYLQRLWKTLEKRMAVTDIGELFAESDLIIRTMRDVYSADITRVIIDDASAAQRARDFLSISNPRSGSNVLVYKDPIPIFHRFGIEEQIEHVNSRTVPLPSGGSLVIDTTEALVAIDVNSGKHRENRDAEMTAYKVNLEAVDEICRQLRLRDLGGVIVNDLIDMRDLKHRRDIENRFRDNLKHDRARTRIGTISQFGVLEMTRQRMRPSLTKSLYHDCPACQGTGMSRSAESMVLSVIRHLSLVLQRPSIARVEVTVSPDVAFQLLNRKRAQLVSLEQQHNKSVTVRVFGDGGMSYLGIAGFDARGATVDVQSPFLFGEPTLEAVAGLLDDSDLGDIVDETHIEETIPNEGAQTATTDATQDGGVTGDSTGTADGVTDATTDTAQAEGAQTSDSTQESHADDLPSEALTADDPLAAARSHYHDGEEEVEAPDEHASRPGFHGPRVVVPAPVAPSLISHGQAPLPPYRQHPQRPPQSQPARQNQPNQHNQNQRGNNQPNAQQFGDPGQPGEGRGGRRRRRRRRGRGGGQGQPQGQPGQAGQPMYNGQPAPRMGAQGDEPFADDVNENLNDAAVDTGSPDSFGDDASHTDESTGQTNQNAPAVPAQPTEAELDELADSIGNLKSPELIELARRRLAAANGQQGQRPPQGDGSQQQGEGGGRRRRRRRRGRGGRGGNPQFAGQENANPNAQSGQPSFNENENDGDGPDHGDGDADAQGPSEASVAQPDQTGDQPAAPDHASAPSAPASADAPVGDLFGSTPSEQPAEPKAPRRKPQREPVPDLVAERLAALPLTPGGEPVADIVAQRLAAQPAKPARTTAREPVPDLVAERLAALPPLPGGDAVPDLVAERIAAMPRKNPPSTPGNKPVREPVPDLVAQRLATLPLESLTAAIPPTAKAPRTTPAPAPTPQAPPTEAPAAPITPTAAPVSPVAAEAPAADAAPEPAPQAPPKPAPRTRSAPKRPLPPAIPLFAPTPEPTAADAAAPAPVSVDPINPVKAKSPIVRPPYRRKKAPAPDAPKPDATA